MIGDNSDDMWYIVVKKFLPPLIQSIIIISGAKVINIATYNVVDRNWQRVLKLRSFL